MRVRKNHQYTTVERAVSNGFNVGILLGFLLGELPARIAGRLAAEKSETQIQKILEAEIEEIFKFITASFESEQSFFRAEHIMHLLIL